MFWHILGICNFICSPSHYRTSTAQGLFKVGPDAGPQSTCVRQIPKIPSALSAFPQWGHLRRQEKKNFICSPSHHWTSTAQGLFKVGPDAGPQSTRIWQNPKIPSAPSAFPQWGRLRRQEKKLYLFFIPTN